MNNDINLYKILELPHTASKEEIKKKYKELSKKFHPDKGGNTKVFELITRSYNILSDPIQKYEYDKKFKSNNNNNNFNNFNTIKNRFQEAVLEVNTTSIKDNMHKFNEINNELDMKHNFKREEINNKISSDELDKKIKELELSREQDDIELDNPMLTTNTFTVKNFNILFDEKTNIKSDIIEYNEPEPWNNNKYAIFDPLMYNNVYVEDNFIGDNKCSNINYNSVITSKPCVNTEFTCDKLMLERIQERENFDRIMKKI